MAGIGLSGREMVGVVNLVVGYVRGAAQGALEAAIAAQRTGISNEEWWAAREPLFDKYFDPARYPTLVELDRAGAFDAPVEGDYLLTTRCRILRSASSGCWMGSRRLFSYVDSRPYVPIPLEPAISPGTSFVPLRAGSRPRLIHAGGGARVGDLLQGCLANLRLDRRANQQTAVQKRERHQGAKDKLFHMGHRMSPLCAACCGWNVHYRHPIVPL